MTVTGLKSMSSATRNSSLKKSKLLWTILSFVPLTFVVVPLILGYLWYQGQSALDSELEVLRAEGLPTTAKEINAFYVVPDGVRDTTELWVNAIGAVQSANLRTRAGELPIVGTGSAPVPEPGEPWADLDAARMFLDGLKFELQEIHKAAAAGGQVRFPVDFSAGIETLLPHTQESREIARILALDAYVSAHEGDTQRSLEDLRGIFALSDALRGEPTLISQLVRIAIHAVGCNAAARIMPHCAWSDAELESLQTVVQVARFKTDIAHALNGERATTLTALDELGLGPLRQSNKREALQFFKRSIEGFSGSWRETLDRQREVTADLKTLSEGRFDRVRMMGVLLLTPATEQVAIAGIRAETRQKCLVAALAVQRFRLQHGQLPESLSEVESLIPAAEGTGEGALVDPMVGRPLRYKVTENRILIYGVGDNQLDDDGDVDPEGQERQPLDCGVSMKKSSMAGQ